MAKLSRLKALRLGGELRKLRLEAGLTLVQVAERFDWAASKVSRQERAQAGIARSELEDLMELYGMAAERRDELRLLLGPLHVREWWRHYEDVLTPSHSLYVALEADAESVREYQAITVPGLLQTQAFATAVNAGGVRGLSASQVQATVEVRLRRQRRLFEDPRLHLHALMGEAALCIDTGGPEVMRDQLKTLVNMARLPTVSLQVVPFSAGREAVRHSGFQILSFPEGGAPDELFVETLISTIVSTSEREVRSCAQIFARVGELALSTAATIQFLRDRMKEY